MTATAKAAPQAQLPAIGEAFEGGFFTGVLLQDGKRYAIVTAPASAELVGVWGEYGAKIDGADSFTDSRANTEAMAASGSDLAQKVLALDIGGFTDWAIPARDAQELQYRHLKPTTEANWAYGRDGDNPNSEPVGLMYSKESPTQTSVDAFKEDGEEAFRDTWYWSSSQRSAYHAFFMVFGDGDQTSFVKVSELRVRPVRSFLIID